LAIISAIADYKQNSEAKQTVSKNRQSMTANEIVYSSYENAAYRHPTLCHQNIEQIAENFSF
jgi:hypothetical protein